MAFEDKFANPINLAPTPAPAKDNLAPGITPHWHSLLQERMLGSRIGCGSKSKEQG